MFLLGVIRKVYSNNFISPCACFLLAKEVEVKWGRLDVLINNAGGNYIYSETLSNTSVDFLLNTFELNTVGPALMIQGFLPLLRKSNSARIVNVSTGAGSFSDSNFGLKTMNGNVFSYAISKLALNGLTVEPAAELANTNIIVNSVCPGFTATNPNAAKMGARLVEEGAASVVLAALIDDNGPCGGFFRDGKEINW